MKNFLFLLGLSALVPVYAQETDSRSMELDFVSFGEDITGLRVTSSVKESTITALGFRYSQPLDYRGPAILEISRTAGAEVQEPIDLVKHPDSSILPKNLITPVAPPEGSISKALEERRKKNPELVAIAALPAGSSHATILLAPGPGGTYLTNVIDDKPAELPFGKMRIHNYCKTPISLTLNGSKPVVVSPRKSFIASPEQGRIIYQLAYKQDEIWKNHDSNLLAIHNDENVHMIILKSDASFFTSSDGSRGGYLQVAILRRLKKVKPEPVP